MDKEYDLLSSNFLLKNAPTSTQRCIDYLDGLTLPEFTSENTQQILTQLTSSSSSSSPPISFSSSSPISSSSASSSSSAQRSVNTEYAEKRKKNNESAKRCRDARIKREYTITLKAVQLEQENTVLKEQMKKLEDELTQYRLYFGQLPSGVATLSHQH